MTFGSYIKERRLKKGLSLREAARRLNLSAPYLCDLEFDRRNSPNKEILDKLTELYELNQEEKNRMFDIAGEERNSVPLDLTEYILENKEVKESLRIAYDKKLKETDWKQIKEFIEKI